MLKITRWIRQVEKVQSLKFGHFLTNLVIFRLSFSHFYQYFSLFSVIRAGSPTYFVKRKIFYEKLIPLEMPCQEKCCDFLQPRPQYVFRIHPTHHFSFEYYFWTLQIILKVILWLRSQKVAKFFLTGFF